MSVLSQAGFILQNIAIVLHDVAGTDVPHLLIVRDVYHARHRFCIDALGCQSQIQALFAQLTPDDFTWEFQASSTGNVTHLFFAFMSLLDLFKSYPEVLLLDCTYKINNFG